MKSSKIATLGILALTVGALAACGKSGGSTDTSKDHVCVADVDAGYQTNGTKHWYKCKDATCKKHVDEANHTLGAETETKAATCTEAGEKQATCSVCNYVKKTTVAAKGHTFGETKWTSRATCTEAGTGERECGTCHTKETVTEDALGHDWDETVWTKAATCTEAGVGSHKCKRCTVEEPQETPALGHDIKLIGDDSEPAAGEAKVRTYTCANGCGTTYLGFKATEVTAESKTHLTFTGEGEDAGASFWGRPIGNAIKLDENGSASESDHVAVYDRTVEGDFFEYKFTLTKEQAAALKTCKLVCDAKPSQYMGQNGVDFWKVKGDAASDWTYGMYIDDAPEHNEDVTLEDGTVVKQGKIIEDFRYVLYVDGKIKQMDYSIDTPVQRGDPRGEYAVPYTFSLHEGTNSIKLVMAGGYRSTFYNFTFRAVEQQGGEHTHEFVAGNKAANSALRELVCSCGAKGGYELQAADLTKGHKAPDASNKETRLGKNEMDDEWNISGIAAGKYELYIQARASAGNSSKGYWNSAAAVANGDSEGNNGGAELSKDYKYKVAIDNGAYVNMGDATSTYAQFGLTENSNEWTNKALCEVTVAAGAKTLTIHNMNNGYSIWVFAARLVKVA